MTQQEQIRADMKEALKAHDTTRLNVLRGVLTAFTNEQVARGMKPDEPIDDATAIAVLKRQVKQRRDSIEQYRTGGRSDLVEIEEAELAVLEPYLPEVMSRDAIEPIVREKMEALGVVDMSGAGKLIGAVMKELKDRANGDDVKAVVDTLLS